MDPVTTALIAAVSSGLKAVADEAVLDVYKSIKSAIKKKLGISKAIAELEANPNSKERQQALAENLAAKDADKDPEILRLANKLIQALQETEAGRKAVSKYHIDATASQVGVIGDGARIEGGIHFHHYHTSDDQKSGNSTFSASNLGQDTSENEPVKMHILHLSDLHFGTEKDARRWHGQLADDLKRELDCTELDAMIITGDVANLAVKEEYDAAKIFVDLACAEFNIPHEHLAIVPGNHDLNWELSEDGYTPVKRKKYSGKLEAGSYIEESDAVIQIRDDNAYEERFAPFCKFYEEITGAPYPLGHGEQGTIHYFKNLDLLILGLNSAWQVDHHFRSRAGICPDALSGALDTIRQNPDYDQCLKFAIWHHPLTSPFEDRITDHGFMERLAQSGFSVCFHGHLHKTTTGLFRYDHSAGGRKIEIVGAGTFGAPTKDWYPGYPLQYNLLNIAQKHIIVRTRCRTEINGTWKPQAIWTQGPGQDPLSSYTITLGHGPAPPSVRQKKPRPPAEKKKPTGDLDLESAIKAYRHSAEALYENLPLMGFRTKLRVPIRIEDIYVPLRAMVDLRATGQACFADAEDAEKKLEHAGQCDDIALPEAFSRAKELDRRGIVILGDPGSGKTTHLKRLLLWCLRQGADKLDLPADMIPVFLPLRDLRELEQGLDAFIQTQLDKPHLGTPPGFGKQLVARGNLLFLLDGLDEVADPDQRAHVSRWIDEALQMHRSCRFVVTCRFAGYTDKARLCEQFLEMHMRPLSFDQVESFVENWYRIVETGLSKDRRQAEVIAKERSRDLIDKLGRPEFRARRVFELTRNPLLLTNLCLVHRDRGNLPHDRARLYEECTDVLLELWRAAIGYQTRVDARSGRKILQPAALWLHQEEGRTRATADELAPVIEPALKDAGWPHGNAGAFLQVVRDESGLLTGWDQEHYGFMHLGFQEYLAARQIQNNYIFDPTVLSDLADRFGQSWWQEVTLLLLCLDNPCLFVPFMREVTQRSGFTQHPDFVEMCLDDAAEKPVLPFTELLQAEPGENSEHWQRQLAALKIVERLDNDALNRLAEKLANHPYDKIRERVGQRDAKAKQQVSYATRGGYELVLIPEGPFLMGSPDSESKRSVDEGPQHVVVVSEFFMGRYPVTNEEYGRFLAENPKAKEPLFWANREYNQPRQPVVGVSWNEARQYAQWAGLQIASEAQWEYACRAGASTQFYSGDTEIDLDRAGWYEKNSSAKLQPVGQKEPNKFGLYDMLGNVWEWMEDDYHANYKGAPDNGRAWVDEPRGQDRVVRGGSWSNSVWLCRSAFRFKLAPTFRQNYLGFRLVLLPEK